MNYCVWLSYFLRTMKMQITLFDSLSSALFCLQLAGVALVVGVLGSPRAEGIILPCFVLQHLKLAPALETLLALSLEPELEVSSFKNRASREAPDLHPLGGKKRATQRLF